MVKYSNLMGITQLNKVKIKASDLFLWIIWICTFASVILNYKELGNWWDISVESVSLFSFRHDLDHFENLIFLFS